MAIARRKKKQVINPPPTRSGGTTNQQTCGNCDYLLPPRKSTEKSMKCPNCGFANTF